MRWIRKHRTRAARSLIGLHFFYRSCSSHRSSFFVLSVCVLWTLVYLWQWQCCCVVMDPGSPSLLWPLRLSKPAVTVPVPAAGESNKAEERAQSPSLVDRLSAAPSPSSPAPASPAPPQHQFQAALVAEKYLLLEQVEGSSLCRCVDVRTQEEYVCKVSDHSISITKSINENQLDRVSSPHSTKLVA